MNALNEYLKLLFRQWWFLAFAILSVISTVSTFVPAFYSRFAVPRIVPFLVFFVAFFVASFRVYSHESEAHASEVAALKAKIAALTVNPDEARQKTLSVMKPNVNMKLAEIVALSGMSEDKALKALAELETRELVLGIDVDELPKGSLWRRI
jgi:hypothetical protein